MTTRKEINQKSGDQRRWAEAENPKTGHRNWERNEATGEHGYYDAKVAKPHYEKDLQEHEHPYWRKK